MPEPQFFYVDPTHVELWGVELSEDDYQMHEILGTLGAIKDTFIGPVLAMTASHRTSIRTGSNSKTLAWIGVVAVIEGTPRTLAIEDPDSLWSGFDQHKLLTGWGAGHSRPGVYARRYSVVIV